MNRLLLVAVLLVVGLLAGPAATSAQGAPLCFGEPATLVVAGFGTFQGTSGRDVILAEPEFDAGAATIYGRGGDDLICPGANDTVYAGSGNDQVSGRGMTAIHGEGGDDSISGLGGAVISGGKGSDFINMLDSLEVYGGDGNDTLILSHVGYCNGGAGVDTLRSHGSSPTYQTIVKIP